MSKIVYKNKAGKEFLISKEEYERKQSSDLFRKNTVFVREIEEIEHPPEVKQMLNKQEEE